MSGIQALQGEAIAAVVRFLDGAGIDHASGTRPGEVVASLPGEHRLSTTVSILVGSHTVSLSAFVCRRPDEAAAGVHEWLLRQNSRLPGIAFALDGEGDVYLVGRLPVTAIAGPDGHDVLDAVLGAVARTADGSFDELLRRGFASAIRAERAWRTSRGLSTANLAAFADSTDAVPGGEADLPGLGHD